VNQLRQLMLGRTRVRRNNPPEFPASTSGVVSSVAHLSEPHSENIEAKKFPILFTLAAQADSQISFGRLWSSEGVRWNLMNSRPLR
jgi:hypothetical protein